MAKAYLRARKVWLRIYLKRALMARMEKSKATELLGGTTSAAANAIGISPQAYSQWPDRLPKRLADRVVAAIARRHLPADLLGVDTQQAMAGH
ncbi:Cro/CI family transcriptional regulator [Cupriavidus pauculus]|uniref:Cro/CI family transcriptional regulator n=1 Tax=Cupriavidus pauculus TaxID=82633 RepID=UPI001D0C29B9|nr:Cro/CI family transcriptional regulator [Cupriavidus pauculus]